MLNGPESVSGLPKDTQETNFGSLHRLLISVRT